MNSVDLRVKTIKHNRKIVYFLTLFLLSASVILAELDASGHIKASKNQQLPYAYQNLYDPSLSAIAEAKKQKQTSVSKMQEISSFIINPFMLGFSQRHAAIHQELIGISEKERAKEEA